MNDYVSRHNMVRIVGDIVAFSIFPWFLPASTVDIAWLARNLTMRINGKAPMSASVTKPWAHPKHHARCLTLSRTPCKRAMFAWLCMGWKCGSERWNNFPKVTQLEIGIPTQAWVRLRSQKNLRVGPGFATSFPGSPFSSLCFNVLNYKMWESDNLRSLLVLISHISSLSHIIPCPLLEQPQSRRF